MKILKRIIKDKINKFEKDQDIFAQYKTEDHTGEMMVIAYKIAELELILKEIDKMNCDTCKKYRICNCQVDIGLSTININYCDQWESE
jgi:hypothetical protein